MLFTAIKIAAVLLAAGFVIGQVRRPSGPLGRRMARAMNLSHAAMTDWALQQVPIAANAAILDIGCGGGRTIHRLAALAPTGTVQGIDYSAASVAAARGTNAQEIASGRVQIQLGSVASLPFPDRTFDLITAVETHYYWPDLAANTREVLRVLKPGGTFVLIAETHRDGFKGTLYILPMALLRAAHLSDAETRDLLTRTGFTEVATHHTPGENWICAVGRRVAERA